MVVGRKSLLGENKYSQSFGVCMKAVGNWVVVKTRESKTTYGIITQEETIGTVIDCNQDSSLVGRTVYFSIEKAKKNEGFLFVPYESIYGLSEVIE